MRNGFLGFLLLLAPLLPRAAGTELTPVLDDGFRDGDFTNGKDPLDTGWVRNRGGTNMVMAVESDPGLASGPALACRFDSTWSKLAAPLGASFGLRGPGTVVRLEFRLRLLDEHGQRKLGEPPNRGLSSFFRFGLYDSQGAIRQESWGNRDGLADGFGGTLSLANATTATNATGATVFFEMGDSQEKHDVLGGPIPEGLQTLASGKGWNGISDTQPHHVIWTLTQIGAQTASLALEVDGKPRVLADRVDLTNRPRAFDTLVFGLGADHGHFALDEVKVLVVPD